MEVDLVRGNGGQVEVERYMCLINILEKALVGPLDGLVFW